MSNVETNLNYKLEGHKVIVTEYRGEKFSDENKEIVRVQEFDATEVPEFLVGADENDKRSVLAYGLLKLLQDRTSQIKDSSAEKLNGQIAYFDIFKAGKWREYVEGAPRARAIDPFLAKALAEIKGVSVEAITLKLKSMETEQVNAIKALPNVQERMKAIKAAAEAEAAELDLSNL